MCFGIRKKVAEVIAPKIKPFGTIDGGLMYAIVQAKLEEIQDKDYDIFIPDAQCKVYKKVDVQAYAGLDEVAAILYISEEHDCDDYARELFGKFAGLIWTTVHAFNYFVDETDTLWYVEPQSKKLSQTIEGWQGWDVRFFIGA